MQKTIQAVKKINALRERILQKYQHTQLFQKSLHDVKRVMIINSSSRSGSSLLYAILRKLPHVYSLSGETAAFYKLNTSPAGLTRFHSDKIPSVLFDTTIDFSGLTRDFFSDIYIKGNGITISEIDIDEYSDNLLLRFLLQWTDVDFNLPELKNIIIRSFKKYSERTGIFNTEDFYLTLLEEICSEYPAINPFYYDLSAEKTSLRFPFIDIPTGPPNNYFNIEEPPFILLNPGKKAGPNDLSEKIFLMKSTIDCYRMKLIEKIFPSADIRIIYLVRNPAATTNGIYDGWLHRGFFSHNLTPFFDKSSGLKQLSIKGYSDIYPFGKYWWNFDLPEGWQDFADRDLIEVCAFQWYSANAEIRRYLVAGRSKSIMIRYENIVRNLESRNEEFGKILNFAGIPEEESINLNLEYLPVVQSTLPPQLYRWKKRKDIIMRLLKDKKILEMSSQLGYFKENMEEWL